MVAQSYKNRFENLRSKRLTLIEKLTTDFSRINSLFDSLRTDAEINGNFAFKNINIIRPMVIRIQSISTDELAVFEEDERLRKDITNIGDFLSSLLIDVDNLENVAQMQINIENEEKSKFKEELKKLRRTIIKHGFQITPYLEIVDSSGKAKGNHYDATISTLAELKSGLDGALNETANMKSFLKDRRIFYSIKCLDSQNQLRSLVIQLEDAKRKYSKRNPVQRFINRLT